MPKIFGIDRLAPARVINDAINGRMDIWQRGTSLVVGPSSTEYQADRFGLSNGMDVSITESRITSVPVLTQTLNYGLRIQPNSPDTVDASDFCAIQYGVEGYDFNKYRHRAMYISFYVRSNLTGTWAVAARSSTTDRSYLASYTINVANTWERKTIVIPFQDVIGGTFSSDRSAAVYLWWALAAGTTFQGAPDVWLNGNFVGPAGMPNFFGSSSNTFDLAGVTIADEMQHSLEEYEMILNSSSISEEIARCERYCQKSYSLIDAPGTNTNNGAVSLKGASFIAGEKYGAVFFRTRMNSGGGLGNTVTIYSRDGTAVQVSHLGSGTDLGVNTGAFDFLGETGFSVYNGSGGTVNPNGNGVLFHWIAQAEI